MPAFPDLNDRKKSRRLVVVFGDQLDASIGALADLDRARDAVLMMEVDAESTHVPSHKQRTALFLSAMRHFAVDLAESGVRVRYVAITDPASTHAFDTEIVRAARILRPESIHATHPGEWRVLSMLRSAAEALALPLELHEDTHFLTTLDTFAAWAKGRKSFVMEHFYREQRKRLGILIEPDGKTPVGGAWNLDADNREPFRTAPNPPKPYTPRPDDITREVIDLVNARFKGNPGSLDTFRWPVTRDHARLALDDFVRNRLPLFGPYEDAMWQGQPFLYHSLLAPAANLKLLDPRDCVRKALAAFESGHAPLNSVEGFIRQWIGWREFIRGVYWTQGEDYPLRNTLGHEGRLPGFYWTGDTDMNCMRDCLASVLTHGFAHHIPRLMVLGNFAMLAGVHARQVADWYLAMFVDAVDWASNPNTIGMSQHADAGIVGTKPYAASGKYIARMSNHCKACRYDPRERTGPNACPFNTLYWDFLLRHADRFRSNQRMAMVVRGAERLKERERVEIRLSAAKLKSGLGIEPLG
jgi:deoxyribodipyrimidine photolyase-related protein